MVVSVPMGNIIILHSVKAVASSKPGVGDYYVKDVYKDISNYNNRKIKFFEDKSRWNSVYDRDLVNNVKEDSYRSIGGRDLSRSKPRYII